MKIRKKIVAILLALAVSLTWIPATVFAEETPEQEEPALVYYHTGQKTGAVCNNPEATVEVSDEVSYFEPDGSFAIEMEPDAFFPYQMQFSMGDDIETVWFMSPDDTVEAFGHVFRLSVPEGTEPALRSLNFVVGDHVLPAYPEGKGFSNFALMSMLPIEEIRLTVDLTGCLPSELQNVQLEALFSDAGGSGTVAAYSLGYDGMYHLVNSNTLVNLFNVSSMELIVGTADPLDPTNKRYIITLNQNDPEDFFSVVFSSDNVEVPQEDASSYWSSIRENYGYYSSTLAGAALDGETYMMKFIEKAPYSLRVYEGFLGDLQNDEIPSEDELPSELEITDVILGSGIPIGAETGYSGEFTMVLMDQEGKSYVTWINIRLTVDSIGIGFKSLKDDNGRSVVESYSLDSSGTTCTLSQGYSAEDEYYLCLKVSGAEDDIFIKKAVIGEIVDIADMDGLEDIQDALFSNSGYYACFKDPVTFTVQDNNDTLHVFCVKVQEYSEGSFSGTSFSISSVSTAVGKTMDMAPAPSDADSYSENHFITAFVLDPTEGDNAPVTSNILIPSFWNSTGSKVYLSQNEQTPMLQTSGVSEVPFTSGQALHYTIGSGDGLNSTNYWVTFITQQPGSKLFVNATNVDSLKNPETGNPIREIFLNEFNDYAHDIMFANVGDAELTGLYVKLDTNSPIALDSYWTIHDDGVTTLAPFTTVDSRYTDENGSTYWTSNGFLPNVSKIQLNMPETMRDLAALISGTLTIGSTTTGEAVVIELTGVAGVPKITTDDVPEGVKYVPYSTFIQNNCMYQGNLVTYTLSDGTLPDGVEFKPNGEIYGVPTTTGEFTFEVTATFKGFGEDGGDATEKAVYTISIADNTDENVWESTDENYEVLDRIPDVVESVDEPVIFRSNGAFDEYVKFFLDGEQMEEGKDYLAEEGSTKITILSQTLQGLDNGKHTIAIEFRKDGDSNKEMNKAAQNFRLDANKSPSIKPGGGSTGGSNGSTGNTGNGNGSSGTVVSPSPTWSLFYDTFPNEWYFQDVKWAYENKLMIGISKNLFGPNQFSNAAMVATVLARLGKIDLTLYKGNDEESDQWYAAPIAWARETKILPETVEDVLAALPRKDMARMLVGYLDIMGVDYSEVTVERHFKDTLDLSSAEQEAFYILYYYGILEGIGNDLMQPRGKTTRAQLAAVLHRLSVFSERYLSE